MPNEPPAACNQQEAPIGFFAVPKSTLRQDQGNLCRQCDWRASCQDPATDLLAYGHRCFDYAVIAFKDGKRYQRQDGCSVVFKRIPQPAPEKLTAQQE